MIQSPSTVEDLYSGKAIKSAAELIASIIQMNKNILEDLYNNLRINLIESIINSNYYIIDLKAIKIIN